MMSIRSPETRIWRRPSSTELKDYAAPGKPAFVVRLEGEILLAEDQERWLTAPVEEAVGLLQPYPSQLMAVG